MIHYQLMHTKIVAVTLVLTVLVWSASAQAAASCQEQITEITLTNNGNILFRTDQTCSRRCAIDAALWPDSSQRDRVYASLLSSQATGQQITLNWPDINSCNERNIKFASPTQVWIKPKP